MKRKLTRLLGGKFMVEVEWGPVDGAEAFHFDSKGTKGELPATVMALFTRFVDLLLETSDQSWPNGCTAGVLAHALAGLVALHLKQQGLAFVQWGNGDEESVQVSF